MMELAQITQELLRMEHQCEGLESQMRSDALDYQAETERGLPVEVMLEWQGRLDSRRSALQHARHVIANLAQAWAAAQARLIEANQDCKVLDRLAERQRAGRDIERARREQRVTDEAASRLWEASDKGVS